MAIIVIDPGHGGTAKIGGSSPNNATSPSGLLEKQLTLAVAGHAATALTAAGHTVHLTRTTDVNLSLVNRAAVAKTHAADFFVSIHFNGFADPSVQGTETWVHLNASSRSQALAASVQRAVLGATGYRDRGVQSKVLGVVDPANHAAATAACLAELSFITTSAEDRRLQDPAYLRALGEAVAVGVQEAAAAVQVTAATSRGARGRAARRAGARVAARSILGLDGRPDPIDHVVVLMLENRSFDHMLGSLKSRFPALDGIDPAAPGSNRDLTDGNRRYEQQPTTTTALAYDPKHELDNTLKQLTVDGPNGGFVTDFRCAYKTPPAVTREVMAYYDYGALPVLHSLASAFTICDRWFSSVPGPTWTNRLFLLSGTSAGIVDMPHSVPDFFRRHRYKQSTIFDRLNEADKSWRVYYGDVPQSLVLRHQWAPRNAANYRHLPRFFEKASGPEEDFPAFAFIEPSYFLEPNDQHPPHDIMRGEVLLARVYNALRANQALWERTLLVVLYDEHGGFYDHVSPPKAVPPDDHDDEYDFDRYGVRVPALLVSPWLPAGPLKTEFDHTTLLRYLTDKWRLNPLGARALHANTFADAFLGAMRTDTPERLLEPQIPAIAAALVMPPEPAPLNDFQQSLVALSGALEAEEKPPRVIVAARRARALDGPRPAGSVAEERVERFLQQRRAQASRPAAAKAAGKKAPAKSEPKAKPKAKPKPKPKPKAKAKKAVKRTSTKRTMARKTTPTRKRGRRAR